MEDVEPYAWAARRDASFLDRPNTRRPKKWHVDRGDGIAACCNPRDPPAWLLAEGTRMPSGDVPPGSRCQRPGCRTRWPELEG